MTLALVQKKSHADLAPSKAHRWLVCPGSQHVSTDDPETEWAAEGTRKHACWSGQHPQIGDAHHRGRHLPTEAGDYVVPLEVLEQCYEVKDFIEQFKRTNRTAGWWRPRPESKSAPTSGPT
jgi:hypothetical protein